MANASTRIRWVIPFGEYQTSNGACRGSGFVVSRGSLWAVMLNFAGDGGFDGDQVEISKDELTADEGEKWALDLTADLQAGRYVVPLASGDVETEPSEGPRIHLDFAKPSD